MSSIGFIKVYDAVTSRCSNITDDEADKTARLLVKHLNIMVENNEDINFFYSYNDKSQELIELKLEKVRNGESE